MSEREYRTKALEEHGDKCAVCDDPEDVVHHRDGDKTNDELSNLVPLCASCHQKVHAGHTEVAELVRDLGKKPRRGEGYPIQVSEELADELHKRKERGDSYEDVIWGLLGDPGITINYAPDDATALFRCNFPGDDPDDRDERFQELFEAVLEAGRESLEEEGMHVTGGGEGRYGDNSVERLFGGDDDIPMG